MKSSLFRQLVSTALVNLASWVVSAQAAPTGVAVKIRGMGLDWGPHSTGTSLSLSMTALNGSQYVHSNWEDVHTDEFVAQLEPGKTYILSIDSDLLGEMTVQAVPPPGYVMEMDRVARERMFLAPGEGSYIRLRVLSPNNDYNGRAGTATSFTAGRIFWQLSLGTLSNGASAGALSFIDAGSGTAPLASLLVPEALIYEQTSSEVKVVPNPEISPPHYVPGTIRQIIAPQVCVDVVMTEEDKMELKVYHYAQMQGISGVRTFTGMPYAWYQINYASTTSNDVEIKLITRELPNWSSTSVDMAQVKVTTLSRTGTAPNFAWSAKAWHDVGSVAVSEETNTRISGNAYEVVRVQDPGTTALSLAGTRTPTSVPWGEEMGSVVRGGNVTTSYDYYTTASPTTGNYGRMRSVSTTGGHWEGFEYYDGASATANNAGALYRRHRPFGNSTLPGSLSSHTAGEVTTYEYENDGFGRATRLKSMETKVNGRTTARTTTTFAEAAAGFKVQSLLTIVTATRKDYFGVGENDYLTTITKYFSEASGSHESDATEDFYRFQTHSIEHPDGRKQSFVYQRATWDNSGQNPVFTLTANNGTDYGPLSRISVISGMRPTASAYTSYAGYDVDDLDLVADKSTMEVTYREYGGVYRTELHVWHAGGWSLVSYVDYKYNSAHQLTTRTNSNGGGVWEAAYLGEYKLSTKDEAGIEIRVSGRDAGGRVVTTTREAEGAISALVTRYTYDAANHVITERQGPAGGENLLSARGYDTAGRLTSETRPGVGSTTYAYDPANRKRVTTYADLSERKDYVYADGRPEKSEGSAVVAEYFIHDVLESTGQRYTQTFVGSSTSARYREIWADWLGRTIKTSHPGFTGQSAFIENAYYHATTGRLELRERVDDTPTTPGRLYANIIYGYDNMGRLYRTGLDVDHGTGADIPARLVEDSNDRIVDNNLSFSLEGSDWWLVEETKRYRDGSGTPFTDSIVKTRLTNPTNQLSETRSTDVNGLTTTRLAIVSRTSKQVTVTTGHPALATVTETITNGLQTKVVGSDTREFLTQYDSLLRVLSVSDPRTGPTTTTYKYGTSLPASTAAAAGLLASYEYDTMGRKVMDADASGKKTRYSYTPRGQLRRQWGNAAYPIEYSYDPDSGGIDFGELRRLRTYRAAPSADSETWPDTALGDGDDVTFLYDGPSGLLKQRKDDANKSVDFKYDARGLTVEREWARLSGTNRLKTTYEYFAQTGELKKQTYNDSSTPEVNFTYTRLGQLKTATDVTGTRTFDYAATTPWQVNYERLPTDGADYYGQLYLTSVYDTGSALGRLKGFKLGSTSGSNSVLEQTWTYHTTNGRPESFFSQRNGTTDPRTFTYSYQTNSDFVSGMSIGGNSFAVTRTPETQFEAVKSIESKWGATSLAKFVYNNDVTRRNEVVQSGTAFEDLYLSQGYTGVLTKFGYNARGELEFSRTYRNNTNGDELPGRRFEYRYDSIGNRKSSGATGVDSTASGAGDDNYLVNSLNQYTQRENNKVLVSGTVGAATTRVGIDPPAGSGPTTYDNRRDRLWGGSFTPANGTRAVKGDMKVFAAAVGGGSGGTDLVRTETRSFFIPKRDQEFKYDEDGNLLHDSVWNYAWDAENRLKAMEHRVDVIGTGMLANADVRRLEFTYDYADRRVRKIVRGGWNGTSYTTVTDTKFIYDGWNLIAELNAASSNTVIRSYSWGLDIAGSPTATGGIGALLQIRDHVASKTLFPAYDANGNVVALANQSSDAVAAAYEYSPAGELIRSEVPSGGYADNPFRFSTKYYDNESGLLYYGHRYYAPAIGRFINRDPIKEAGGFNLYAFGRNDAINGIDVLGLDEAPTFHPVDHWDDGGIIEISEPIENLPPARRSVRYTPNPPGQYAPNENVGFKTGSPTDVRGAPNSVTIADLRVLRDIYVEAQDQWFRDNPNDMRPLALREFPRTVSPLTADINQLNWLIDYGIPWATRLHNRYRDREHQTTADDFNLAYDGHYQYLLITDAIATLGPTYLLGLAGEAAALRSALTRLGPNARIFMGMEVRAVRSLAHVDEATLRAMAKEGFSGTTINGDKIIMHHHKQRAAGPVVEVPAPNHTITNARQHPFGNQPGGGLTAEERAAFNQWRQEYWKMRAREELARRGLQ